MKFLRTDTSVPLSSAVLHGGAVVETVLTGIPPWDGRPVPGGAGAEMREIFRQLDEILAEVGLERTDICSARIYLRRLHADVAEINGAWREYFGEHPPNRRCYGVDLQLGMLVEAAFVAELRDESEVSAWRTQ